MVMNISEEYLDLCMDVMRSLGNKVVRTINTRRSENVPYQLKCTLPSYKVFQRCGGGLCAAGGGGNTQHMLPIAASLCGQQWLRVQTSSRAV